MKNCKIKDATIAITYRCNARCMMCNIWQRENHENEISSEVFLQLPKSLKSVNLSGGEPFLRNDIVQIVRSVKERVPKAKIIISSNGLSTNLILEKMKEICMIDLNIGVAISLDGMSLEHNKTRGVVDGFENSIKTIEGLKRIGVKNIKIAFTLGDHNHGDFRRVYDLSKDMSVEFTLAVVHSAENYFGKNNKIEKPSILIDELNWLIKKEISCYSPKRWFRAYFAYGLVQFLKTGKRVLPDYSGELSVFVDPHGTIFPCDVSNDKIGKLTKAGFKINESSSDACINSWMICTARQAMKKHFIKVIVWIIWHKITFYFFKNVKHN